jgi:hypothetical protein
MNVMLHNVHCVKYLLIYTTFLEMPLLLSSDSTNTTKPVMVDPLNRAISKCVCMPNMSQTMENVKQNIHIITEISIMEQFLSVLKDSQYYKS